MKKSILSTLLGVAAALSLPAQQYQGPGEADKAATPNSRSIHKTIQLNSASPAVVQRSAPGLQGHGALGMANCDTLTSVTASPAVYCAGSLVDLSAISGGDSIRWYDAAVGGNLLGTTSSGSSIQVSPTGTTTYYAEVLPPASIVTQTFGAVGYVEYFNVPTGVTSITIDAIGAQGGNTNGGKGARMVGTFAVTPGDQLGIAVGMQGVVNNCGGGGASGGGGGGTFVWNTASSTQPMIASGGGGGGNTNWSGTCVNGIDATTAIDGLQGNGAISAMGGTAGNGGFGNAPSGTGSGGAGWLSAGQNSTYGSGCTGGLGPFTFLGGSGSSTFGPGGEGGFGGGGGAVCGCGGGGGYSGGGGGEGQNCRAGGGGGGSYNVGTNQNNQAGYQLGNGLVTISFNGPTCVVPPRQAVTVILDTLAPVADCQNISISLDSTGSATITEIDVDAGSADNCGISSINASQTTFDCSNIGDNNVVLTVSDDNGNMDSCVAVVSITYDTVAAAFTFNVSGGGMQYDFTDMSTGGVTSWAWDFGGGGTSTLQNPSFTFTQIGYQMICLVAYGACDNDTACAYEYVVSNIQPFGTGNVQLWPNPTNGQLNVRVEGMTGNHLSMELFNLEGKRIMAKEFQQVSATISESMNADLPAGTYMLRVDDGVNRATLRVVIQ